jgi:hydroxymethylbilane synthase
MNDLGDFAIVQIRGNVPTRIAKLEQEGLDGVVLAAAGVQRLGIDHPNTIELPPESFLPAPGQGAVAVQARTGSTAHEQAAALDHMPTRTAVIAERAFLREINAGCHTPIGAVAKVASDTVLLHGRLFSDDFSSKVEGTEAGIDPTDVGVRLARRLVKQLSGG